MRRELTAGIAHRTAWSAQGETGRLAAIFGLWAAVVAIYWPSAQTLNGLWTDWRAETYSHGYLALLLSLWLVWRKRSRLAAIAVRPDLRASVLLIALSAVWLLLWRAAIQQLHLALLPLLLFVAVAAVLGWRSARTLIFPIGYLYFAMPIWSDLFGVLQALSVKINGMLMWLTGIPGFMQGNVIQLPGGGIEIAQGCAGLHDLIVGMALGALYGELMDDPLLRRIVWVGVMGALALIANWVRIFVITVAAYKSDMRTPLIQNHYWFGWGLFLVAFILFLWLAGRLAVIWDRGRRNQISGEADQGPAVGGISALRVGVALACLGMLPAIVYGQDYLFARNPVIVLIDWPDSPAGWRGPQSVGLSEWQPDFERPSAKSLERYTNSQGDSVEAFTAAYRAQTQDSKLLGYENSILGEGQDLRSLSQRLVDSAAGRWLEIQTIDPAGARSLIWSRYRIGNQLFVRPRLSQLWYGLAALVGHPVSSITAFRAQCRQTCAAAQRLLAAAAERLQPPIRTEMCRTGASPACPR